MTSSNYAIKEQIVLRWSERRKERLRGVQEGARRGKGVHLPRPDQEGIRTVCPTDIGLPRTRFTVAGAAVAGNTKDQ